MIAGNSSGWSIGTRIEIGWPTASSAVYPYMCSAPRFQLMIVPSRVFPMIASSEESTIAARYSGDKAVARFASSGASVFTNRSVPGTSSGDDGAASQPNLTGSLVGRR